jgi:hypothetical protein
MTPEQEQRMQAQEVRVKRQALRLAVQSIPGLKPETFDLLDPNVTPKMVEFGDDYRVEGHEHLTLGEYLSRQFKSEWSFFRQGSSKKAESEEEDFDLDSFVPGQATDEQRAQLRAAMRKAAGL